MKPFYGKTFKDIAPPTECGKCGASWVEVRRSLLETPGTDNWEYARKIIGWCFACQTHFRPLLKKIKEERDNLEWLSRNIP